MDIPSTTELPTFDTAKGSDITPPEPDTYQESNMPSLETEQTKEPDTSSPETVTYEGVTYTVISLGSINPDGTFGSASILNRYVVSLTIPKTVQCIWSDTGALNSMYLKTIVIHPDNPYYRVEKIA